MQHKEIMVPSLSKNDDDNLIIIISTDILGIPLKENITCMSDIDILLEGEDKRFLIVSGNEKEIFDVIDLCYNARETNVPCTITFSNNPHIIFK